MIQGLHTHPPRDIVLYLLWWLWIGCLAIDQLSWHFILYVFDPIQGLVVRLQSEFSYWVQNSLNPFTLEKSKYKMQSDLKSTETFQTPPAAASPPFCFHMLSYRVSQYIAVLVLVILMRSIISAWSWFSLCSCSSPPHFTFQEKRFDRWKRLMAAICGK